MDRDGGGLRRKSFMVRPQILMYPQRMALRRVVLEREPRAGEMSVVKEASLRFVMGGTVGLMERAGERVGRMCGVSGGWWGGGGGMWSRHTFSLARLEPTRTGVGSPGAKMNSVVGVRRQEPEV
jgi:hypothetical protein